jgi:cytochrome c553
MMSTRSLLALIAAASLCASAGAHAARFGDAAAGEQKSATCAACHGADGNSQAPTFPKLAGQHADYLVHSLRQYRSGERQNAIMMPQAANLSDKDIDDLAAFYASQQGLRTLEGQR